MYGEGAARTVLGNLRPVVMISCGSMEPSVTLLDSGYYERCEETRETNC
jgi:hypothetical protein